MAHSEQITRSWEINAEAWTRAVRDGLIPSRRIATDRAIVDAVVARQPARVLDAGCGEGWLLRSLWEAGVRDLVGFDASPALIAHAQPTVSARLHVATYDEVAARVVSFGEPFDAILCNFALLDEHIGPLLQALAGALRLDGCLYIQTLAPQPDDKHDEWRFETFQSLDGDWQPMPYYFRTVAGWRRVLQGSGLDIVAMRQPTDPGTGRTLSLLFECTPSEARVGRMITRTGE